MYYISLKACVVTVVAINRYRAKQKRKEQRYKYFTVNRIK
jgi:hypothetical protein